MCFQSSFAETDAHLLELQTSQRMGELFAPFRMMRMTAFFEESGLDLDALDVKFRRLFLEDPKGKKLLGNLVEASAKVNGQRMGLPAEENFAFCLEGLIDYAIFGETLSGHGLIIGCES